MQSQSDYILTSEVPEFLAENGIELPHASSR